MPVTVRDISRNADTFRAAYPNWPATEPDKTTAASAPASRPEITATSPAELTDAERQMLLEDQWREACA
jgi:hypothetical protein